MRLEYVKARAHMHHHAVVELTGRFLAGLAHTLESAELELSVLKQATAEKGISHLHDYTDANEVMLQAMSKVFPDTEDEDIDIQDPFISALITRAWSLAARTLELVYEP